MPDMTAPTTSTLAEPSREELLARIAELEARNNTAQNIRYKVSEKGALSIYGLNAQFPTTLYLSQWERLIGSIDSADDLGKVNEIKEFCRKNRKDLKAKGDKAVVADSTAPSNTAKDKRWNRK